MSSCRLCSALMTEGPAQAWDKPLFQSPNFVVLPSLGALVEGWLLLVPKQHFLCMGALPDELATEMQDIKERLCLLLRHYYGHACAFEHGPSKANTSVGCGVDHAHLHLVPLESDLRSSVIPFLPDDVSWTKAGLKECQAAFNKGEDYLYLEQPIGTGHIATHRKLGSQLFRRAIASEVGALNQFNWREYPQLPNVLTTIEQVRTWDRSVFSWMSIAEVAA